MQLFTHLRALLWGLVGNTVSPGHQQWRRSTSPLYCSPKDGDITLDRSQAPFNCLSTTLKSMWRLGRYRPLHPAGIKSLSALAPIQAEVQKVNYKINKRRESKWDAEPFNLEGWNHCGSWGRICCEFRRNQDPFQHPRVSLSLVQRNGIFSSHFCHGNHYRFSWLLVFWWSLGLLCWALQKGWSRGLTLLSPEASDVDR